jgi:hypothetical protein
MLGTPQKESRTSAKLDLTATWRKAVQLGQIRNELYASGDDPEGRWKSGDKILFAITHSRHGFSYAGKNLSTDKVINDAFAEKKVPGTEFHCQLNAYRTLRPEGGGLRIGKQPERSPSSNECGFFCKNFTNTMSLLRRAPLAQVMLKNHVWNGYYNAAPLEMGGHFIWVPVQLSDGQVTLPHFPQTLNTAVIEDCFLLHDKSANLVLFFNSLHAGASVNHLHVHTIRLSHPLAIEKQRATLWRRVHVLEAYPVESFLFEGIQSVDLVSEYVVRLQEIGIPFNLVWIGKRVFLMPRNIEHEVTAEFPFDAFSAIDICGKIVTTDRGTYDSISKERIEETLMKSTMAASKFLRDWDEA